MMDNRGRRQGNERRQKEIDFIPDRRCGEDRRSGFDRRSGIERRSSLGVRVLIGTDRRQTFTRNI